MRVDWGWKMGTFLMELDDVSKLRPTLNAKCSTLILRNVWRTNSSGQTEWAVDN